jgi:hypothetical protein
MNNRLATWLMVGMLPLLAACATSSHSAALSPVDPQLSTANELTSKECANVYTVWDDALAKSEADIVRLPDGQIVGLLPPEGTP